MSNLSFVKSNTVLNCQSGASARGASEDPHTAHAKKIENVFGFKMFENVKERALRSVVLLFRIVIFYIFL